MIYLNLSGVLEKETKENVPFENLRVNFDQFCAIVAEFKSNQESEHLLHRDGSDSVDGGPSLPSELLGIPTSSFNSSTLVSQANCASIPIAESAMGSKDPETVSCMRHCITSDSACSNSAWAFASVSQAVTWFSSVLSILTSLCKFLGISTTH